MASNPAVELPAHIVTVTALACAIARIVAHNADDAEFEAFVADFKAKCEGMARQYRTGAIEERAAAIADDLIVKLRDTNLGR